MRRTLGSGLFSSIWGVHFVRGHLRVLGLGKDSPEYGRALELFAVTDHEASFDGPRALVTVKGGDWKGPRRCTLDLGEVQGLPMRRLVAELQGAPETAAAVLRGDFTPELERTLDEARISLYPVKTLSAGSDGRDWIPDAVEKIFLVLCAAEALVDDPPCVRSLYSRTLLAEWLDPALMSLDAALGKALRTLTARPDGPPLRNEARAALIGLVPREVAAGDDFPAWLQMLPNDPSPAGSGGDVSFWAKLLGETPGENEEREMLEKLAAREKRWVGKARNFLAREAESGHGRSTVQDSPWKRFRAKGPGVGMFGKLVLKPAPPDDFFPTRREGAPKTTSGLAFSLSWDLLARYVEAVLFMPREDAEMQDDATVCWRAVARCAFAYMAAGAELPAPFLDRGTGRAGLAWLPRLDLPDGEKLFCRLAGLISPFAECIFPGGIPFAEDDPERIGKTVLLALASALSSIKAAHAAPPDEAGGLVRLLAMRRVEADGELLGTLRSFFALPLALLTLPGRPAVRARRGKNGSIVLVRGILPLVRPSSVDDFVAEEDLAAGNRESLRLALDAVVPARSGETPATIYSDSDRGREKKFTRQPPPGISPVAGRDFYRLERSALDPFLVSGRRRLESLGVETCVPRDIVEVVHPELYLSIDEGAALSGGFLGSLALAGFDWHAALGGQTVPKDLILRLIAQAGKIVEFGGRRLFLSVDEAKRLKKRIRDPKLAPERLGAWDRLRAVLFGSFDGLRVEATAAARARVESLMRYEVLPPPEGLAADLRPYQTRGFSWIMKNLKLGLGALIADDMGLGKTVQVIAALLELKNEGGLRDSSVLVVAPASIMANWEREVRRFAPGLTISIYHGVKRSIDEVKAAHDIVITSYGTFRRDAAELGKRSWRVLVLDEAQAIKNFRSSQSEAARLFPVSQVIGMTGTPVENRLLEYWSILAAVQPGLLGGKAAFEREFVTPIEKGGEKSVEALSRFKALTAPFILRRVKTDRTIIADLPEKNVIERYTTITPRQLALYRQSLKTGLADLRDLEREARETRNESLAEVARRLRTKRGGRILLMIMQLKQITNSPSQFEKTTSDMPDSGKGESLIGLLEEARDAGKKALVFTQFREMGELLRVWVANAGLGDPPFLHGGVPVPERPKLIEKFQNDPECRVMILTLKAGGTGLNLTAASIVIHYDLWWNPAVENQATDRAYRIGQGKDVLVYRFVTAGTFEERINKMLETKRKLADLTVLAGEKWLGDMSEDEIAEIFRVDEK